MRSVSRWILVLFFLSVPMTAFAQVGLAKHFVSFGVGGGMSVPVSHASDAFENGFNVHGFARLNTPKLPVMPRFDLSFTKFDLDESNVGVPGTGQILAGLANVQVPVMNLGLVRPYLIAGLGAYNVKVETEGTQSTSESDTRFGINGGAGVNFNLGVVKGYVEGRVDNVFTEEGMIDASEIQVVPVTFGVIF